MVFCQIDPNMLHPDGKKKYVKLVAQFSSFHRAEQVIPVSFRSGYIFIQTDKPVYNPGDSGQLSHAVEHFDNTYYSCIVQSNFPWSLRNFPVRCRAFVSDTEFRASERIISLEIQVSVAGIDISVITVCKAIAYFVQQCFMAQFASESRWYYSTWYFQSQSNRWDTIGYLPPLHWSQVCI